MLETIGVNEVLIKTKLKKSENILVEYKSTHL